MMKNRFSVVGLTSFIGLAISFLAGLSLFYKDNFVKNVQAATDVSTYYNSVNGTGTDLLNSICTRVNDGYSDLGYDGLKSAYATTDVRSDGKLYDIYSNCTTYTPGSAYASSYSDVGDGYNREHTIPKSWWGGSTTKQGSDIIIVLPSDAKANGMRSNYPYGECTSGTEYKMDNDPSGNRLGTSTSTDYVSGTVFEPFADRKGDLARTYFYAVVKYWKTGADNGSVLNWTSGDGAKVFSSSGNNGFVQKYLNMLLKWHNEDPVSQWEITRNDNVENVQGNRNPFIDHPSWTDLIWGGTYTSSGLNYENTNGGTASVVNGQISGGSQVASLSVSPASGSISVGNTINLVANSSGGSGNVTWTITNGSSYVSLSSTTGNNIVVTGVAAGSATIQASYSGVTANATITVTAASQKTLSSISVSNQITSFTVGDSFSFGGTVTANFSDSTSSDVTSAATFSGYNMSTTGNQTVTVSYTYSGTTKTTTYQITVNSSGGSGGGSTGTQRISASTTSTYYLDGDICPTGDVSSAAATCDAFDVSWLKNSGSSNIVYTYAEMRVYASHSFTFTPKNGYVLTSIVITANNSSYANAVGGSSLTNCSKDTSSSTVTLTPIDGESAIGFTNSAQARINYIVVNFSSNSGSSEEITYISATPKKTFYVGETITSSDITVKDNNNNTISSFSFTPYQFVYSDASSSGALTNKTFTDAITYESFICNLTVQVQRKAYSAPSGTSSLEHTGSEFSNAGIVSSYATGQTATVDGVTFSIDGYIYNSKLSLSASKTSATGKVINTTPYPAGITNVSVSGASPDIQLSTDGNSWVNLVNATTSTTNYFYLKLYYSTTTQSNYVNITSFTVTLKANETPENVANYIMYEDTSNQCTTKFDIAKGYFESLTSDGRSTFMTSDNYVISTARNRFEAWARNLGKTINQSNGDYVISNAKMVSPLIGTIDNNKVLIIIIASTLGVSSIGGYFFLKRKETK